MERKGPRATPEEGPVEQKVVLRRGSLIQMIAQVVGLESQ